jgi:hypothetical protein
MSSGADASEISIYGFRDGLLVVPGELVKEAFEDLKSNFAPDHILTMTTIGIRTTDSSCS